LYVVFDGVGGGGDGDGSGVLMRENRKKSITI
jgi:hypothetical protein